jgi:hypothetical protein
MLEICRDNGENGRRQPESTPRWTNALPSILPACG